MGLKNKEEYNKYMKEYMRTRYENKRKEILNYLGGCCKICGRKENLQVDHIDRESKELSISKVWNKSWEEIVPELNKCQILCQTCHNEKTIKDLNHQPNKGVHGRAENYSKYGCRCEECKAAKSKQNKKYKKRRIKILRP